MKLLSHSEKENKLKQPGLFNNQDLSTCLVAPCHSCQPAFTRVCFERQRLLRGGFLLAPLGVPGPKVGFWLLAPHLTP